MATANPLPSAALLSAEGVSREFRLGDSLVRAVDAVSISVAAGEFVALLGSSGSGKSTLLNLLAGLDRPTSGAIRVQGRDLAQLSSPELARYRRETAAMVFQSFNLLPRMTLEENVELPLRLAEVDRGERGQRVTEALDRVGLAPRRRHRPSELSGGEQQRGAIARALVNRHRFFLPMSRLASGQQEWREYLQLLAEIQKSLGMTIILVTHERPAGRALRQSHDFSFGRQAG